MPEILISASGLHKKFGEFVAVKDVDLQIRRGECFGLLGPNGAGKSTVISMIYGAASRTGGDLRVLGMDPQTQARQIKKRLGVVTQENALDETMTVQENMVVYATFVGVPRGERRQKVEKLLTFMALDHKKDARIGMLSGGMKRRLVFVRALMTVPDIVILDEPTTGLDPAVRHMLWARINELKNQGSTVLLTTHYMDEAELLCDRLAIMDHGSIRTEGRPRELIQKYTPGFVATFNAQTSNGFDATKVPLELKEDSNGFSLRASNFEELATTLKDFHLEPDLVRPSNLEDVFLHVTGKELSPNA